MKVDLCVPESFRALFSRHRPPPGSLDPEEWLDNLPAIVAETCERWGLRPDGPAGHGHAALVVAVRREDGSPAALKVSWPHDEAREEGRTLVLWGGHSAVRLLGADPHRWALLLEWLDPTDLTGVPVLEHCETLGRLAGALDRPAPPWAPRLSDHLHQLVDDIEALRGDPGASQQFPRRLLDQAAGLASDLAGEPEIDARLVHTDLHQMNVLWRPDPGQWVAIDPKPMAADPAFVVAPALWNVWERTAAAHDIRTHLNLRLEVLCEAAGVDSDRARALSMVRMVRNALWDLRAPEPSPDYVTRMVTICKALLPG